MAETINSSASFDGCSDAVCIDANKIYDSCCDKDCLEDLQVLFTDRTQPIIDQAISVKCTSAEVLNVFTDVEPVAFNRGFFTIDTTFFFLIKCEVFTAQMMPPVSVCGLAVFSKKCILYGSEGNVKIFGSETSVSEPDKQIVAHKNMPRATVQVVEPIVLSSRLAEGNNCCDCCCVPKCISCCFEGSFNSCEPSKNVLVTLGLFTILQLSRNVQLLIPVLDFCVPEKECNCNTDSPCDLFRKIKFPKDEFFPPRECKRDCGCGCSENDS